MGSSGDEPIRITRKEAMDERVDGLLARQAAMLGEARSTGDAPKAWYYQNWFVLMGVGLLAGLVSWALIEPFFDDFQYTQGPIAASDLSPLPTEYIPYLTGLPGFEVGGFGWIEVDGEKIWIHDQTRVLADGEAQPFSPVLLLDRDQVGVHVEYVDLVEDTLVLASFVDVDPPDPAPGKAGVSLRQQTMRTTVSGLLLFAVVAGLIGLAIGAADGLICRLLRRAVLCGLVGLGVGFVGGFISGRIADLIYMPINMLAMGETGEGAAGMSTFGFLLQLFARSLAWAAAGATMGLGQGIVLRSKRLLLYGFLGGIIGGLLGGLLFDPIDLLIFGADKPSAHISRLVGLAAIGACVGGAVGVVELLTRDYWLRMVQGPLRGKEFLVFKDRMVIGSSPRSDIYLFNDDEVVANHAVLRVVGDQCEIESLGEDATVTVNHHPVGSQRLRHGDQIGIGNTAFVYEKRGGA